MRNPYDVGEVIGRWLASQGIDNALVAASDVPVRSWTFWVDPHGRYPDSRRHAVRVQRSDISRREMTAYAGEEILALKMWPAGLRLFLGVVGTPARVAVRGPMLQGAGLAAPIGLRIDRPVPQDKDILLRALTVRIDFARKGDPHLRVIGATGAGKTTILLQLVHSLARQNGPEQLRFLVISNREMDWWPLAQMRHAIGGRIPNEQGAEALAWAAAETRRREQAGQAPYWLFVVVDDTPDMLRLSPDAQPFLAAIARQGRAQHVGLWLAGQSAAKADVGGSEVHANITSNIVLKVPDADSARRATGLSNTDAHRVGRRGLGMVTVGQNEAVPVAFGLTTAVDLCDLAQGDPWPMEPGANRRTGPAPLRSGAEPERTGRTGLTLLPQNADEDDDEALPDAGSPGSAGSPLDDQAARVAELLEQGMNTSEVIGEVWGAKKGSGGDWIRATQEFNATLGRIATAARKHA